MVVIKVIEMGVTVTLISENKQVGVIFHKLLELQAKC